LGDQICCEVAVRAVRHRYPDAHITWATDDPYFTLLYDQTRSKFPDAAADEVLWPDPWDEMIGYLERDNDIHLKLDGPEMAHQLETDYALTESRIETWCKYVDFMPTDMSPRWHSTSRERETVIGWLASAGLSPFKFCVVQYQSAESKKDYAHTAALVTELQRSIPVVVVHHGEIPTMGTFAAINWPLRELAILLQLAGVVVGPDSSLQHLSAAVKTPSVGLFGPTDPRLYLKHYPLSTYVWNTHVQGKECEHTFPCFGISLRKHWCRREPQGHPWCLASVPPEEVAKVVMTHYQTFVKRDLYVDKARALSSGSSSLFYFTDPRVDLPNLEKVQKSGSVGDFRKSDSVERIC
jgi:hypothetical protein